MFLLQNTINKDKNQIEFRLHFMGHYNEPCLDITHSLAAPSPTLYNLAYDPHTGIWTITPPKL